MINQKQILENISLFDNSYNQINKSLNCFTANLSDFARTKSQNYEGSKKLSGKLIAIKDNINIQGYPTTCTSEILDDYNSLYNATVIDRILNAEGLIVAKTNMDEFAMGSSTEYSKFGSVTNPYNSGKVSGGSSGGSAASVSGTLIDIALGSDTGGSVRQPASFCGVYGLKPTYGRISRYGLTAFASSLDQIGIFSKTTMDLIDTFDCLAGYDENDSTTSKLPVQYYEKIDNINLYNQNCKIKIGYSKKIFDSLAPEIAKEFNILIDFLKTQNIDIQNIDIDISDLAIPTYYIIAAAEASSNLSRFDGVRYGKRGSNDNIEDMFIKTRSHFFGDEVKRRIMLGNYVLSSGYYDAYYEKALKVRRILRDDLVSYFNDFDLLVLPTAPSTAFNLGEKLNKTLDMYLSDIFTIPISLAGLPAINLPLSKINGLPIGIQICANYFEENKLFALSQFLENQFIN